MPRDDESASTCAPPGTNVGRNGFPTFCREQRPFLPGTLRVISHDTRGVQRQSDDVHRIGVRVRLRGIATRHQHNQQDPHSHDKGSRPQNRAPSLATFERREASVAFRVHRLWRIAASTTTPEIVVVDSSFIIDFETA